MEGWLRTGRRRASAGSTLNARLPGPTVLVDEAGIAGGRQLSEADLHGYIDNELDPMGRVEVEAFLAAHPRVAERIEGYRSQVIAAHAAFRAGETPLPPAVERLARRYARAVALGPLIGAALGVLGLLSLLCVLAQTARGA